MSTEQWRGGTILAASYDAQIMTTDASPSPLFSVIVPTFGRAAFLRDALDSIAAQTVGDFECIVVDDCSPDPVALSVNDARFRLVRHRSNTGPAAARNTGLDAAIGQYVCFLDDDDLWCPRRLELTLSALLPGRVVICAGGQVGSQRVTNTALVMPFGATVMDRNPAPLGRVTVARSECPRFDDRFTACEDLDWWIRASATLVPTVVNEVGWLWRQHASERVTVGPAARIAGSKQLMEVHSAFFAGRPQARAYRWLRIAWLCRDLGDRRGALRALGTALRAWPRPLTCARAARVIAGR